MTADDSRAVNGTSEDESLGARRERAYGEWLDGPDYFSDCDEYGSQRAAFYAGIGWGAREIRRLESAQR